jgi:hypothetical protein
MNLIRLGVFLLLFAALCVTVVAFAEGRAAFRELIDAQFLDRVRDEPNAARAFYLGVFFAGFAPWSLFAFIQLFRRGDTAVSPRSEIITFSKIWLLVTCVLLTLANVKHTRYLLPAAPPTALLCAAFWEGSHGLRAARYFSAARSWIRGICITLLAAGTLFAIAAPIWLPFASVSLTLAIPAAGLLALATVGRRPAGDIRAVYYRRKVSLLAQGEKRAQVCRDDG